MSFYKAKIDKRGRYKRTEEIKKRCSQVQIGRNKGIKRSIKTRIKISEAKKLYWANLTNKEKEERLKKLHSIKRVAWNKGLRSKKYCEAEIARNSKEYTEFRKKCFERDKYTCQITGKKGGRLVVHHIWSFTDYPKKRFLVDNGITMREKIHNKFHSIYGKKHNNLKQLLEFMEEYR